MARKKKLGFLSYIKPIPINKTYTIKKEFIVEEKKPKPFKFANFRDKSITYPSEIKIIKYKQEDLKYYKSNEFLESFEWRKLRLEVILKYGRKCQCCGAKPPNVVIHVDHIKPRKTNPELALDINNLQVLCHECNHGKGNWNTTDFR